jgi:hypothetical protein
MFEHSGTFQNLTDPSVFLPFWGVYGSSLDLKRRIFPLITQKNRLIFPFSNIKC